MPKPLLRWDSLHEGDIIDADEVDKALLWGALVKRGDENFLVEVHKAGESSVELYIWRLDKERTSTRAVFTSAMSLNFAGRIPNEIDMRIWENLVYKYVLGDIN